VSAIAKFGDPTTTGGRVLAVSNSTTNHGVSIAWHGDKATCGVCKGGPFPIMASGTHMRNGGRAVVVHGDWVLCPCKRNRVIATATNMNYGHRTESQASAARQEPSASASAASASTATATINKGQATHSLRFCLTDSATGVALARQPVRITADGQSVDQVTDDKGCTALVYTGSAPKHVICHILGIDDIFEGASASG
jgi:uncharacterized Zn-binding protein involved in type VI secretion